MRKFSSEKGVGLDGSSISIRAFRLDIPLKDKLLSISFYLYSLNLKLQTQTKKVDEQEKELRLVATLSNKKIYLQTFFKAFLTKQNTMTIVNDFKS